MPNEVTAFTPEVAEKLKTYVYRLIDPRNGETFYVGKGKSDRVFAHIHEHVKEEEDEAGLSNKLKLIRDIHLAGFEVAHVIHRHGMDEKTAFEVEAALIDAYFPLANIASGHNTDRGVMHAEEIVREYNAEPAVFQHKALLVNVSRYASEESLYEATRSAWKVSLKKVKQAEVILPTLHGLIKGAYIASEWLEATTDDGEAQPGRFCFVGTEAPEAIKSLYVGKRVPDEYRKPGSANPVRYTWH